MSPRTPFPCLTLALLLNAGAVHASAHSAGFPHDWIGHWKGDATSGAAAEPLSFTMELIIAPTEQPDRFGWTIIYDGEMGRQERPYTLVVIDAEAGRYAIDEGQGIILDARLFNDTLWSHFLVQNSRIVTRERLELAGTPEAHISVEMLTTLEDRATVTGGENGVPEVRTWMPVGMQQAKLRRVRPEPPAADPASGNEPAR